MNLMPKTPNSATLYRVDATDTGAQVITNSQAQEWARTDADFTDVIAEITDLAEQFCNASFIDKTITAQFGNDATVLRLPYGPVKAITSTTAGVEYTLRGDEVYLKTTPNDDTFTVTYTTGYTTVPNGVVLALKKMALSHFEDRQDNSMSPISSLPNHSRKQLLRYKRY